VLCGPPLTLSPAGGQSCLCSESSDLALFGPVEALHIETLEQKSSCNDFRTERASWPGAFEQYWEQGETWDSGYLRAWLTHPWLGRT